MKTTTQCECELAGFCKRHRAIKRQRHFDLCQTDQVAFERWEAASKPRSSLSSYGSEERARVGREAWAALHAMKNPTLLKIDAWVLTVPAYGCQCRKEARAFIRLNPPDLSSGESFFRWTWEFHDWIDQKTGDERMTFEKAREFWGSSA